MRNLFAPAKIEIFPEPLVGIVEQTITETTPGRVKFLGTSWSSRFYQSNHHETADKGQTVKIIGMQGITLL
ncbi:MAG: NfeD family protein, partial [Oscillatoria sp. PMC 1076.18]|nr:NfeD family protein [Oscillatoria sp. PMC 1076.18]